MDKEIKLPEHYIFAYILQPKTDKMDMLQYIADKYELPIVCVSDMNEEHLVIFGDYKQHDFNYVDKMAVSSWLTYIKCADLVVSDSYHGMCFSLIFEKQFLALYPRDGLIRFSDLVAYLGIYKRFNLSNNEEIDIALLEPVDYSTVSVKLKEKVVKDRAELDACLREAYEKALSNPTDDDPEKLKMQIIYNRALKELG